MSAVSIRSDLNSLTGSPPFDPLRSVAASAEEQIFIHRKNEEK
jgi:hypothetical protein